MGEQCDDGNTQDGDGCQAVCVLPACGDVILDQAGRFPYDYKYGRNAGEIQEYVKVVPFSRRNLSDDVLGRIESQMPFIYSLIEHFHQENPKTLALIEKDKI